MSSIYREGITCNVEDWLKHIGE